MPPHSVVAMQHKLLHTVPQLSLGRARKESADAGYCQIKSVAPLKDLYDIGEIPPLGHVPEKMHAWAIRKDRHGPPDQSFQLEVVPTWTIGEDEVLSW